VAVPEAVPTEFDVFFSRERRRLFRALVLLCGDAVEAEDLAQEAFVRVFERWDRVARMDSPVAYLYAVAVSQHRSRVRRAIRWARRGMFLRDEGDASDAVAARVDVRRALASLTLEQRNALVLVDWVGLSSDEAARALSIEPGAVRARVHRARERLRRELTPHE
jgi:RNA polymerase sigma factor (sigma-70 family)